MNAAVPAPSLDTIRVRRMDLDFPDAIPRFWFDGNPYLSSLLGAMSVSFPAGERYFIRSVLHFLPRIDDPQLREAVRGFVGQEGNHTKEHLAFNRFLGRLGYPAAGMEKFVEDRVTYLTEHSSPEENLARTVALEHFTAILAGAFLEHPELLDRMSPECAKLWAWHAIEEIEHRSVAFDVYRSAVDDEALRIRTMLAVSVIFSLVNLVRTAMLLHTTGDLTNLRAAREAGRSLFGSGGLFRGLGARYLAFFRADFHPSQHDFAAEVARAKQRYLDEPA